jgi:AraC-like DNA-binding protein
MKETATRATEITSCYMGPAISPEQFVPEHSFLYLAKGNIEGYDGHKKYTMQPGEYCMVLKNHLARYNKQKDKGEFEKVVVVFDHEFLKTFKEIYKPTIAPALHNNAFLLLKQSMLVPDFIRSLMPYYHNGGKIDETFARVKREELLLILLKNNPEIADILFDFGIPQKLDLEAYMNRNYTFNVTLERFAYLTGRSLSAFKRDFAAIFNETPARWLLKKRLQQARFMLEKNGSKASEIYLDLGFEDLSHFSFAFKKLWGYPPTGK